MRLPVALKRLVRPRSTHYRAPMRNRDIAGPCPAAAPARRSVAWTVAIALLVNVITVTPIMLRMAVAGEATMAVGCPMTGMAGTGDRGHQNPIDHSHCLFCTGGIGVALLAANVAPLGPSLVCTTVVREQPAPFPSRGVRTAYVSRAPPVLA